MMLLGPRHDNELYLLNLRGLHAMMKHSLSRVALRLHVNDADPKLDQPQESYNKKRGTSHCTFVE